MSFWMIGDRNDGALLDAYPQGGPEGWLYLASRSLAADFPKDLVMRFSPNFPDRRKVYDFVDTILDIRVVSERVRRIVQELAPQDVEFLPITLVDHQGDVASREHFIMNVLARRDVIDLGHSDVRMSHMIKEEIDRVRKLVLKEDLPQEGPKVFRPLHLGIHAMINATVHAALTAAGPTGVRFIPANGWNGKIR